MDKNSNDTTQQKNRSRLKITISRGVRWIEMNVEAQKTEVKSQNNYLTQGEMDHKHINKRSSFSYEVSK